MRNSPSSSTAPRNKRSREEEAEPHSPRKNSRMSPDPPLFCLPDGSTLATASTLADSTPTSPRSQLSRAKTTSSMWVSDQDSEEEEEDEMVLVRRTVPISDQIRPSTSRWSGVWNAKPGETSLRCRSSQRSTPPVAAPCRSPAPSLLPPASATTSAPRRRPMSFDDSDDEDYADTIVLVALPGSLGS